jgi:hypothetical protein
MLINYNSASRSTDIPESPPEILGGDIDVEIDEKSFGKILNDF